MFRRQRPGDEEDEEDEIVRAIPTHTFRISDGLPYEAPQYLEEEEIVRAVPYQVPQVVVEDQTAREIPLVEHDIMRRGVGNMVTVSTPQHVEEEDFSMRKKKMPIDTRGYININEQHNRNFNLIWDFYEFLKVFTENFKSFIQKNFTDTFDILESIPVFSDYDDYNVRYIQHDLDIHVNKKYLKAKNRSIEGIEGIEYIEKHYIEAHPNWQEWQEHYNDLFTEFIDTKTFMETMFSELQREVENKVYNKSNVEILLSELIVKKECIIILFDMYTKYDKTSIDFTLFKKTIQKIIAKPVPSYSSMLLTGAELALLALENQEPYIGGIKKRRTKRSSYFKTFNTNSKRKLKSFRKRRNYKKTKRNKKSKRSKY